MRRIPMNQLKQIAVELLEAMGVPSAHAEIVADAAVNAEACGVHTHGLTLLMASDRCIGDTLDPRAEPRVVKETVATALIDGNSGFGPVAMKLAVELARRKVAEAGVAMIGARNTSWIAALGPYLIPLARDGLLAQLWAQTNSCTDCAPVGGIDARLSTNPLALAFPTSGDPMVADISSATVSMGKAYQMMREGHRAEEPIFMDSEGNLTDDPQVLRQKGSILLLGGEKFGHKGYALSLWCEAVSALAGGSCNNPEVDTRQNFNLTVIDPEAFVGAEAYYTEMRRFVPHLKSSRPKEGVTEILLPGERACRAQRDAQRNGVPVPDHVLDRLKSLIEKHELNVTV